MSQNPATSRYLENEILGRSPEWLVPLLFEHLLINLKRAQLQTQAADTLNRAISLSKASSILFELLASLSHDGCEEISGRLSGLYGFWLAELMEQNRTPDVQRLGVIIEMVGELHQAFLGAAEEVAPRRGRAARGLEMAVA